MTMISLKKVESNFEGAQLRWIRVWIPSTEYPEF